MLSVLGCLTHNITAQHNKQTQSRNNLFRGPSLHQKRQTLPSWAPPLHTTTYYLHNIFLPYNNTTYRQTAGQHIIHHPSREYLLSICLPTDYYLRLLRKKGRNLLLLFTAAAAAAVVRLCVMFGTKSLGWYASWCYCTIHHDTTWYNKES